jgi:Uma2 family endonuclease
MATAPKAMTLEEFLELPEQKPALEYIGGVVRQKVSPKSHHSILQSELVQRVDAVARHEKVARAFPELRSTFSGEAHVPDVSVYRWERIPRDASGVPLQDFRIPPDVAIEIASPRQSRRALDDLCRWYVSHGVALALLVDPATESVRAFLPDARVREWRNDDQIQLGSVVPGFALTVEELFRSLTE